MGNGKEEQLLQAVIWRGTWLAVRLLRSAGAD